MDPSSIDSTSLASPRQITQGPGGRILTNTRVWSPDGQWIVYDVRSDPAGERFDGDRIEVVHTQTGEVRTVYQSRHGAKCGVATFHPREPKVVFILGPENPAPDWEYNAWHRQGVVADIRDPRAIENLDARDIIPPFTPGALRGGSHVHVWDGPGHCVSFTYEDHVLAGVSTETATCEMNLRNVGVSIPGRAVQPASNHARNHAGSHFSVLVSRTTANPEPGSDQISRAFEEAWVGTNGYLRADGSRQERALAFQGNVKTASGEVVPEVFMVDLPSDLTVPGDGPLEGTLTRRPFPPRGVVQRRLTFTAARKFPGIQGPRHWVRSAPDGSRIAFLMRDNSGVVQIWTVAPHDRSVKQLTSNPWSVASAFDWSADGRRIAHVMDGSVCLTDTRSGLTRRLTPQSKGVGLPRPEACVFSPDATRVAYVARVQEEQGTWNQIFVVDVPR